MTPSRLFATLMALVLLGYAFLDRGFASLPYSPLFVGELVLLVGVVIAISGSVSARIFMSPVSWFVLAFVAWGLLVAVPDVGRFGIMVYRDSVVWIYALFALLVGGVLIQSGSEKRALDWFGRWSPWFLLWAPAAFVVAISAGQALPRIPGSDVSILTIKPGDLGVHVAGIGAFIALGLHRTHPLPRMGLRRDLLLWTAWTASFMLLASKSRGGMLAIIVALGIVFAVRRVRQLPQLVVGAGLAAVVFAFAISFIGIVDVGGRTVSIDQIVQNAISIVRPQGQAYLAGTIEWRLEWWRRILNYTVLGDNFWTGKGFGVNLADSDGFQTNGSLRSPHNAHITILARSGVPGLALWTMILVTFYASMIALYTNARRNRQDHYAKVSLWLMAYIAAFLVNMSFDVYLEGPQGGIWFWSVIGFGIALSERQRREKRVFRRNQARSPQPVTYIEARR